MKRGAIAVGLGAIAAQPSEAYRSLGDHVKSTAALEEVYVIMQLLAERINDQPLRQTFSHAAPWATETPPASG
jgi:hypothetical protein